MQGKREIAPCLSDAEIGETAHKFCPFFVHIAHVRGRRSEVRPSREHLQNIFAPFGDDLNLSGGAVSDPSLEPQGMCFVDGGIAEPDAVNAAADNQSELLKGSGHWLNCRPGDR